MYSVYTVHCMYVCVCLCIMMSCLQDSDFNAGQIPENIPKNRYKDILPYEVCLLLCLLVCLLVVFVFCCCQETRVKLNPDNNTSHNDYINASYVDVSYRTSLLQDNTSRTAFRTDNFVLSFIIRIKYYVLFNVYIVIIPYLHTSILHVQVPYRDTTHHYIVAQGPLEHTCADFWQMVWEKRIQIIVMLTEEWVGIFGCCQVVAIVTVPLLCNTLKMAMYAVLLYTYIRL